jgi:hypothetical protein
MNPLEIFGNKQLEALTRDMLIGALSVKKSIQRKKEVIARKVAENSYPEWMYYFWIKFFGVDYEEFWNEKVSENLAKWMAFAEGDFENQEWEEKFEYATSLRMEDVLRNEKVLRNGMMCCPFHKEKTPSLKVYYNSNSWHCFGCGAGTSPLDFVMKKNNLDFKEAVNYVYHR